MGLLKKFNTLLQHPLVETIINLIKKFKSSKSYWSVSYLILLFTIREAIAWQFGSAIREFCEKQASDSDYATVWDIVGFVFDTGGSIELVGLGLFIFLVLSIVKVSEANGETKPTPFREKLLGFVIALALILVFFTLNYYQHQSTVSDINQTIQKTTEEVKTHTTNEESKTRDHVTQALEKQKNDLLKELNIFGNKEKFLQEYFGEDWQQAIENPQTYHNLKQQLLIHEGSLQKMIQEKKELLQKIQSRRLNNKIQTLIDKAFAELRFEDVRELLDVFIENNKDTEQDLLNAHYQKALSYMQEIKYHEAKEEYETYIPMGIKDTDILHDYGTMYRVIGEYDKYLEVNTKRLALLLEHYDLNSVQIAITYNGIGFAWHSKGEDSKAIEYHSKALDIQLATLGENHPSTATSYTGIGSAWESKGNVDKAIEYYSKSLNIQLTTLGEEHPDTAIIYNNIGEAWRKKGEYDKAIEYHFKSLKIRLATVGERYYGTANSYNNIGAVWHSKRELNKAIEYYSKALEIRLAILGKQHPDVGQSYNNIGLIWSLKGEYDKATKYHSKTLKIRLATVGEQHPDTAIGFWNMAVVYYYKQNYKESYEFIQKAVQIFEKRLPENHPHLLSSKRWLKGIKAKLDEQK